MIGKETRESALGRKVKGKKLERTIGEKPAKDRKKTGVKMSVTEKWPKINRGIKILRKRTKREKENPTDGK